MNNTTPPYGFKTCSEDRTIHALARLRIGNATSLRERLLAALTGANPAQSLKELDPVAEQLGAYELVVYIYALLDQPFIADQYELVSKCLFKLAYRLFSVHTISEQKWSALLDLLAQKPNLPELAKVLAEPRVPENDDVSEDFSFDTWNALGFIFNLSNKIDLKSFKKAFIDSTVTRVLDDSLLSAEKCFQLIVFVECMCAGGIDAEVRIKQEACQLFVLEAIATTAIPKKIAALFQKFNALFMQNELLHEPENQSRLFTQFSIGALEWVHYILAKAGDTPVLSDCAFAMGVLANPAKAPTVKHSIVFELTKGCQSFELSFLQKFFACQDLPEQLLESLFSKDWTFDKIRTTYETANLKPHYYRYIQELLDVCPPSRLEIAKKKCVLAIKKALESYRAEERKSRNYLKEELKQLRIASLQAIEAACNSIIEDINIK